MIEIFTSARVRIMMNLKDRPHTLSEIARKTGYSKTTVSYHLSKLHELGLVDRNERGKWVYYRLTEEGRRKLRTEAVAAVVTLVLSVTSLITLAALRIFELVRVTKAPEIIPARMPKGPAIAAKKLPGNLDIILLVIFLISLSTYLYLRFRR